MAYGTTLNDNNIFQELGFCTLEDLFTRTVIMRHNWSDEFKEAYDTPRLLRNKKRFKVPYSTTKYGEARRSVYIPKIFNELADEFFLATSKNS